jgi:hypothetical protein
VATFGQVSQQNRRTTTAASGAVSAPATCPSGEAIADSHGRSRSDIAAARAGHQAVTAWIAELADFLAGHTNQLPAPDPALPGTPPAGERR